MNLKLLIGLFAVVLSGTVVFYLNYSPDIGDIEKALVIGKRQDDIYLLIKGKIDREPLISYAPGFVPKQRSWTVGLYDKTKFIYFKIQAEFDGYIGNENVRLKNVQIDKVYKFHDDYGGLFWAKIWG